MRARQTVPRQWLIIPDRVDAQAVRQARTLATGTGILLLQAPSGPHVRRLRQVALQRRLVLSVESRRRAVRGHNLCELRRALRARTPLVLLSPIYPTRSHPERKPLHRMKAAAMTRASSVPVLALGGMSERRFRRLERLGFHGWAGIDAWIRT